MSQQQRGTAASIIRVIEAASPSETSEHICHATAGACPRWWFSLVTTENLKSNLLSALNKIPEILANLYILIYKTQKHLRRLSWVDDLISCTLFF